MYGEGSMHARAGRDRHARQQQGDQQVTAGVALTQMPFDLGGPEVGGRVDERGELIGVGARGLAPSCRRQGSSHLAE